MLCFIDESWQTIDGQGVGALGGVAFAERRYNAFCHEVLAFKRIILKAEKLSDGQIKASECFSRKAFRWQEQNGYSTSLRAAEAMFAALERHDAKVFVTWTTDPQLLLFRNPCAAELSKPYRQLLCDIRGLMRNEAPDGMAVLSFDRRHARSDEETACAISNYLFRARGSWSRRFVQIPNFTLSSVSPGLQAADLMVHLASHLSDRRARTELSPYLERMLSMQYEHGANTVGRSLKSIRQVE